MIGFHVLHDLRRYTVPYITPLNNAVDNNLPPAGFAYRGKILNGMLGTAPTNNYLLQFRATNAKYWLNNRGADSYNGWATRNRNRRYRSVAERTLPNQPNGHSARGGLYCYLVIAPMVVVRSPNIGPRGPVSGNGRTWPEPNGSGRRGSAATGSGATVSILWLDVL